MKIILSRKGFDSGAGGNPSPLIPCDLEGNWIKLDASKKKKWSAAVNDWEHFNPMQPILYKMHSIPIPQKAIDNFTLPYSSLCTQDRQGLKLTEVLNDITHKSIKSSLNYDSNDLRPVHMHLDPDININTVSRCPNNKFYPAFGQCNLSEKFLQNQRVSLGDIFIFFGLFQEIYWTGKEWAFLNKTNGIYGQVIWGYMKICDILTLQTTDHSPCTVGNIQKYIHTNVSTHPHMSPRYHKEGYNRIYIGDEKYTRAFECYDVARDLTHYGKWKGFTASENKYVNFWKNQSLVDLFNGAATNGNSKLLKVKDTSTNHYIYAKGQWQEAVIDLEKKDKGRYIFDKGAWKTYLNSLFSQNSAT